MRTVSLLLLLTLFSNTHATDIFPIPLTEYVPHADKIATFRVVDAHYEQRAWVTDATLAHGRAGDEPVFNVTRYTLEAVEAYRGMNRAERIEVYALGGEYTDDEQVTHTITWSIGYKLRPGEEVLMLVKYDPFNGIYRSLNNGITVYDLVTDKTGSLVLQSRLGAPVYLSALDVQTYGELADGSTSTPPAVTLQKFIEVVQ